MLNGGGRGDTDTQATRDHDISCVRPIQGSRLQHHCRFIQLLYSLLRIGGEKLDAFSRPLVDWRNLASQSPRRILPSAALEQRKPRVAADVVLQVAVRREIRTRDADSKHIASAHCSVGCD